MLDNLHNYSFLLYAFRFDNIVSMVFSSLLFQMLRIVEVLVGSNRYASVICTAACFMLPVKYVLHRLGFYSSGLFFLTGALTAYYWKVVPSSIADSLSVGRNIHISNKVVCIVILLLSSAFSGSALLEVLLSFCIGSLVTPSLSHPAPFVPFPKGVTSFLSELYEEPTVMNIRPTTRYAGQGGSEVQVDEDLVQQLMDMGFEREDCVRELRKARNDVNVAANRLLNAM